MKKMTQAAALAAIAIAGFSAGFENVPFVAVRADAAVSAEEAAKKFNPKTDVDISGKKIRYKLPAGVRAKIIGTTYEQIVDFDGKIRRPISKKTTRLTLELSDATGKTAKTATFDVSVDTADAPKTQNANAKPAVIPALQEWVGETGAFVPAKDLTIVVPADSAKIGKPTLRERAELFAKELSEIFGKKIKVVDASSDKKQKAKTRGKNDANGKEIILKIDKSNEARALGKEGYTLVATPNKIEISAPDPIGAFWGTRTILQVFKQNENTFPCGTAVDYPQYPLRGFMYDVGRKPATLKAVKDVLKTMAYYKLNDYHLHLNDNFIWMYEYTKVPDLKDASDENKARARAEVLAAAPTAFRLESDVVGKDGTRLTASDYFYTKKDFGNFIDEAKLYGVNIVPEFDVPGHAMSFVRVRPDLMYRGGLSKPHDVERTAMLDASNDIYDKRTGKTYREETLDFVQSVFDEYLVGKNGEEPVFRDCTIHIGTDEYYGNAEDYRAFANAMLDYVKSRGRTPRLWGSFSVKHGKTPVDGNGAQIDIWNFGWQNPNAALDLGFDIINILDGTSYIVPNGYGNVGGYGDLLNLPFLYSQQWHPSTMEKMEVTPGLPKLLGAQFAVWNDNSFFGDMGLTDYDLFDRIRNCCAVFAEKTWNNGEDASWREFKRTLKNAGVAPLSNPEYKVEPLNADGLLYSLEKSIPAGKVFKTEIAGIAPDYEAEFRVKLNRGADAGTPQVIFAGPAGKFLAVQKDTGKVGITRDTWDYSFDYKLPEGRAVTLKLVAKGRTLKLFADGVEIGSPVRSKFPQKHRYSTFVFPLKQIGSKNSAVDIESLKITSLAKPDIRPANAVSDAEIRDIRTSSSQSKSADTDFDALTDGDTGTFWHSRYAPAPKDNPPFEVVIDFSKTQELSAFAFLPRQDSPNGNVKRAEVFVKTNDGDWKKVATFSKKDDSKELQKISFPKQKADALKFLIIDGDGGFGTLAEVYPIKSK